MTDMRKVWALIPIREASDSPGDWWHEGWITSANFVDAAVLSELVDAARRVCEDYTKIASGRVGINDLVAALAAFDAAMRPDGETARRTERFRGMNDRIWGEGNWIECPTCPPDNAGNQPFHHVAAHDALTADTEGK